MADRAIRYDFLGRDVSASRTAGKVASKFDSLSSRIGRFGHAVGRGLKLAGAAMGGLAIAGVTMGIKTAASLEQAEIAFGTLLKSGKKARSFLGDLKRFATKTPFELPGLIDSSRLLLGVGVASKQVIPLLQAFGDTAGAVGIQQDAFQRVMLALSQTISAGKLKLGDMNQLMTNGIPIWKLLSEAIGKPVPEIQKLISHGKLLTKDVLPKLQAQMEKDYGGAMERQSRTLTGLWSTFMDTINIGLADAIRPFQGRLKAALAGAIRVAGDALGAIPGVVDKIGKAFQSPLVQKAKGWANAIIGGVKTGLSTGDWGQLGSILGNGLRTAIGNGVGMFKQAFGGVDWLNLGKTVAKGAAPFALGFFNEFTSALLMEAVHHPVDFALMVASIIPVGRVAGIFGKVFGKVPVLGPLLRTLEGAGKMLEGPVGKVVSFLAGAFKSGFGKHFPGVASKLKGGLELLRVAIYTKFDDMVKAGLRLVERLASGMGSGVGRVAAAGFRVVATALRPFGNLAGKLIGAGRALIGGLAAGIRSGIGTVLGPIQAIIGAIGRLAGAISRIPSRIKLPSIPKFPKLPFGAAGAIVTRPTLSLIGERGPEALIPLNRTPGARPLAGAGAGGPITINVYGVTDPRAVALKVRDELVRHQGRNGTTGLR